MRKLTVVHALLLSAALLPAKTTITVLATTDLHGNIYPYDYFTARPAERGLAKLATIIKRVRAENPNTLLIDCGDTIQGTPLESVYQDLVKTGKVPETLAGDPMMRAMNYLRYDAMVLGNHEFNFGLKNLSAARTDAKFPWLSANTMAEGTKPFEAYVLKTLGDTKVALIGITTPAIPQWEKPENYRGYKFSAGVEAARRTVEALRAKEKPHVVLLAAHAGFESRASDVPGENMVGEIASQVPGIDAIIYGHTHQQLPEKVVGGVLVTQPRNWGISIARVDIEVDGGRVVSKRSRLLPVTQEVEADAEVLRIGRPYHAAAEQYLDTPVGRSAVEMLATFARIRDSALLDAIQQVQLHYAQADVSFASLFNQRARIPKGAVTVREIAALYIYDNELYAVEGTGRTVREALENSARYFTGCGNATCSNGPGINRDVLPFNYDVAQGVEYEVDLAQPEGKRIRNLRYKGRPLGDDQKLRIAVNSYRAGGSAGYTMFRGAPIVWRSSQGIRDLMVEFYSSRPFPAKADDNWRIVPLAARVVLQREARRR
jgi:2',3'-cyclic-nucleotide 2'-phosphodiesterase/3'-nucleotidase